MIQVTFAHLMPEQPSRGSGFYLDGKYAGYIGQDCNGEHFVYFTPFYWWNTRIREARGYVMVTGSTAALSLVRRLVTRLAHRQLVSRARSICNSPCASSFYRRVLADLQFQRRLAYALIDERTWNDPSRSQEKSDPAFTPECVSQNKEPQVPATSKVVYRVLPARTWNLICYTNGSYRRISAADIQFGAEPSKTHTSFPFAQTANPTPTPPADNFPWALFLPMDLPLPPPQVHLTAAPTTTRNTQ